MDVIGEVRDWHSAQVSIPEATKPLNRCRGQTVGTRLLRDISDAAVKTEIRVEHVVNRRHVVDPNRQQAVRLVIKGKLWWERRKVGNIVSDVIVAVGAAISGEIHQVLLFNRRILVLHFKIVVTHTPVGPRPS